jgi:predicted glycosyltransferase involved in capsule biosynthesis
MLLTFCITIKNRKYQLEQTLLQNLLDSNNKNTEFILIDFGSTDGLKEYIYNNFKEYLESKKLKYYYTDKLKYWHASIAKNTTHKYANGKYIVNLDCDNILIELFKKNDNIIISQGDTIFGSGNSGRISLLKENFIKLGGYNEYFYPMGYQDSDLLQRAIKYGLKLIKLNKNNLAIKNSKIESIKNTGTNINYYKMNQLNTLISKLNIENNDLIANKFKSIGLDIV